MAWVILFGPISLKVNEPYELELFGDEVINEIGNQVKILIDNAYVSAQKILMDHKDILDRVAQKLLEKEKISAEEFESLF